MNPPRYSVSRRRACTLCASRKVRCDGAVGGCSTCAQRGEECHYPSHRPKKPPVNVNSQRDHRQNLSSTAFSNGAPTYGSHQNSEISRTANDDSHFFVRPSQQSPNGGFVTSTYPSPVSTSQTDQASDSSRIADAVQAHGQAFDFTDLELDCPINAGEIQNRWLSSYVSGPGQTKKDYPKSVVSFMSKMLKSYVIAVVDNQGWPPWVHFSQIKSTACTRLPTCLALVRQFANSLSTSRDVALDTVQREMSMIHQSVTESDDMAKLAIFQAYLIYTMVLYFCIDDLPKPFLREAMINVQELACTSSRGGLVCLPKQQHNKHRWEAWITAEAKRRTLYTMYMFDSILLCRDGVENYLGSELRGLPAPGAKGLWQAKIRCEWDRLYDLHLTAWPDGDFRIDELWPTPSNLDEVAIRERQRRIDQWLTGVDEYGTMLFAVTSCTHGS